MNSIDNSNKLMFFQPDIVRDLLAGCVQHDWVKDVNFVTLTPVATERFTEKWTRRINDMVWKTKESQNLVSALFRLENADSYQTMY